LGSPTWPRRCALPVRGKPLFVEFAHLITPARTLYADTPDPGTRRPKPPGVRADMGPLPAGSAVHVLAGVGRSHCDPAPDRRSAGARRFGRRGLDGRCDRGRRHHGGYVFVEPRVVSPRGDPDTG